MFTVYIETCKKCGSREFKKKYWKERNIYKGQGLRSSRVLDYVDPEHLEVICECGYLWRENCLDKKTEEKGAPK